jgi:hypothetical protein
MTERPILFSGPMVRALLADKKTMTRRVIDPQPSSQATRLTVIDGSHFWKEWRGDEETIDEYRCRYGKQGTRLWVRETWRSKCGEEHPECVIYNATDEDKNRHVLNGGGSFRPSIFMPRWASRITLEITGVRVERLQEISTDDIQAEGILPANYPNGTYIAEFAWEQRLWSEGWDKLNAKRGFGWEKNPWVFVISFRKI